MYDRSYSEITIAPQAAVRPTVLAQVLGLLGFSFVCTALGAWLGTALGPGAFFPALFVGLGALLALYLVRERSQLNLGLLYTFATAEGVTLGLLLQSYLTRGLGGIVIDAAATTAAITLAAGCGGRCAHPPICCGGADSADVRGRRLGRSNHYPSHRRHRDARAPSDRRRTLRMIPLHVAGRATLLVTLFHRGSAYPSLCRVLPARSLHRDRAGSRPELDGGRLRFHEPAGGAVRMLLVDREWRHRAPTSRLPITCEPSDAAGLAALRTTSWPRRSAFVRHWENALRAHPLVEQVFG